ncbi:MAG: UDP-N-acetylmuramate dehydrogenase [Patescibacteria group bacterium]|nr:UDP-N-acetylmuramate dehydrogenase [Patescibacteria group bacterium]
MKIFKDKYLAPLTNFKIGGRADYYVELKSEEDINLFLHWHNKKMPFFIMGGATNILINDFHGVIIRPQFKYIIDEENEVVKVGSGIMVAELLEYALEKGYEGLEWAGGLPGTVGGAVEGGVGCFGGEFKNIVMEVMAVNILTGENRIFNREECLIEYRNSFFKKSGHWLIVQKKLIFNKNADKEKLKMVVNEKINYRQEKHPLEYPNAGSVFKNYPFSKAPQSVQELVLEKNVLKNDPFPIIPTAFLISEAGLKGKRIGDAQISEKHSNFIINLGRATFNDVYQLIDLVKKSLEDKFQIQVENEIRIVKDEKIF